MTTWVVVLLLANQQIAWIAADRHQCVSIEEEVALGRDVGLTDLAGAKLQVRDAVCMTREEAEKRFGFWKGTPV